MAFSQREVISPDLGADGHLSLDQTIDQICGSRPNSSWVDETWLRERESVSGSAQLVALSIADQLHTHWGLLHGNPFSSGSVTAVCVPTQLVTKQLLTIRVCRVCRVCLVRRESGTTDRISELNSEPI